MSSRTLFRWGGLVMLVGSVITALSLLVQTANGDMGGPLWVPSNIVQLVGVVLIIIGFPAFYAALARMLGGLGLIGYVLVMATGMMAGIGGAAIALVVPSFFANLPPPSPNSAPPAGIMNYFIIAGFLQLVGGLAFGIALLRSHVLERLAGLLLIIGAVVAFVGNLLPGNSPLGNLGSVLFVLALAWMGFALMTRHVTEMETVRAPEEMGAHARA